MFRIKFALLMLVVLLNETKSVAAAKAQEIVKINIEKSDVMFPYQIDDNLFAVYSEELYEIKSIAETGPRRLDFKETANAVRQRNHDILKEFRNAIQFDQPESALLNIVESVPSDLKKLADSVLAGLPDHPIVGRKALEKYDPTGEVGFCFGRSAYVHLELLRRGYDSNKIGKIFALGNFNYKGQHWDFHVATFIWDNKSILVIDDTVEKIMTLKDWVTTVEGFDVYPDAPKMMIYITDPSKFHPALGFYSEKNFKLPQYNNYFVDLKNSYKMLNFDSRKIRNKPDWMKDK